MIWSNDYLKNSLYQGSRLSLQMEVQPVQGDKFTLTEQNLLPGTFSIDRYVQSSDKLEIGSACASELSFVLDNLNGEFDGVIFEGAEIVVSVTITEDEYKIGTFTVDEKPRKLTTIKIKALDDMVKLDKPLDMQKFPSSSTLRGLIDFACTECNVSYNADDIANYFSLPNRTVTPLPDGTQILYRDLIRYVCQLGIVNAYMDKDNVLRFGWYGAVSTGYSITPYERTTHTIEEKSIGIASLTVEYEDTVITAKNTLTNEDVDYSLAFTINGNPLAATSAKQAIVTSLFNSKLKNLTYRPFSASVKQMFPLEPMDGIVFVDKNENEISTFLTHTNFRLNGNMKIEAKGESPTKSGYAAVNPLTAQEQKILDDLRKFVTAETAKVTDREYQLIEFNKAINSGMALHKTTVNGVEYYHDNENITLSDYIMVQNSAGVAWTDSGWNDGSPVWKYGISSNGEAILNSVDAYKIRADLITVTDLKAFGATIGGWNIGEDAIYKDVGTYRAYLQSPGVHGLDTWILSAQKLDDLANPNFFLTMRGELYLASDFTTDGSAIFNGKTTFRNNIEIDMLNESYKLRVGKGSDVGAYGKESAAFVLIDRSNYQPARLDFYPSSDPSTVMIRSTVKYNSGFKFGYMSLSNNYLTVGDWESGNYAKMKASSFDVVSEEDVKTNIASMESVLDLFSAESSQIYSYNLKKTVITETEEGSGGDVSTDGDGVIIEEQVEETTSYGFVIGDGYAVPEQVLNKDGNAINLYSMAALTWKAVQELYLKIKALEGNANAE